jgi:cysteinyl-tRNA synthetase
MRLENMASTKTILSFLMTELEYGQTYSYEILKEARQQIQNYYKDLNSASLEEAIGQLEEMAEDAKRKRNYKLAFDIRKELSKIQGHYTEKIQLSGSIDTTVRVIKLSGPDGTTD